MTDIPVPEDVRKLAYDALEDAMHDKSREFSERVGNIAAAILADREKRGEPVAWRYEIQYGPDGEANYAWVYRETEMVATMRTHHAQEVVRAMTAPPAPAQPVDVDAVAKALHESCCEQDINGYLAAKIDCKALAAAAIGSLKGGA